MKYAPPPGEPSDLQTEIRRIVMMWGSCCISPIIYLGAAWIIKQYFMDNPGYFPFSDDAWSRALIGLTLFIIALQGMLLFFKHRYRSRLAAAAGSTDDFVHLLTRRTFILIFLSEMAVFSGFCLFLAQGDLAVVFGSGLVAMFFYAQSHPRSAIPHP